MPYAWSPPDFTAEPGEDEKRRAIAAYLVAQRSDPSPAEDALPTQPGPSPSPYKAQAQDEALGLARTIPGMLDYEQTPEYQQAWQRDRVSNAIDAAGRGGATAIGVLTGYRPQPEQRRSAVDEYVSRQKSKIDDTTQAARALAYMGMEKGTGLVRGGPDDLASEDLRQKVVEAGYPVGPNTTNREAIGFLTLAARGQREERLGHPAPPRAAQSKPGQSPDEISKLADLVEQEKLPPSQLGRTVKDLVNVELARRGRDPAQIELNYEAKKHSVAALNSPTQVRLGQAVGFVGHNLPVIEALYKEWQSLNPVESGFKTFNRATLKAAAASGGTRGAVASTLLAAVNDYIFEQASVMAGGNSPSEEMLRLASHNLGADADAPTFEKNIGFLKTTTGNRARAMTETQPAGASAGSRWAAKPPAPEHSASEASGPAVPRPRRTDPATGEVREWDGTAWVVPGGR